MARKRTKITREHALAQEHDIDAKWCIRCIAERDVNGTSAKALRAEHRRLQGDRARARNEAEFERRGLKRDRHGRYVEGVDLFAR